MFEIEKLHAQVKQTLLNVPADHTMAFVTIAASDGVRGAFAIRVNDEWVIEGYGQVSKDRKVDYGVVVQWSR